MDDLIEQAMSRAFPEEWSGDGQADKRQRIQAVISAIQETHAIVPKEPTVPMVEAGLYWRSLNYETVKIYKAMIEASPHFPTSNPSTSPTK